MNTIPIDDNKILYPADDDQIKKKDRKKTTFNYIVTNARSLAPKMRSLIENFVELDLSMAIVTESWLRDGSKLDECSSDLEMGKNLKIIRKNRPTKRRGRTAGGGVAIVFDRDRMSLKERKIKKTTFEILCAEGRITGLSRNCLLYTSPSPRDRQKSRMPSSA